MLIDWFTVVAQIVNFLVLVWLLKRVLYKPVLSAIDAREKRIASQVQKAQETEEVAKKERDAYQQKNKDLEKQKEVLLSKAAQEAQAEKKSQLEAGRKEFEAMRLKQNESLKSEHSLSQREFINRAQSEVFAITRKALKDLASEDLETRLIKVFAQRLCSLPQAEKAKVTSGPAVIRTAFPLSPAQQTTLTSLLKNTSVDPLKIQFEIAPNLVSGIELTVDGNRISWDLGDYLGEMEETIKRSADEGVKADAT
jgi:F-type H+-transporting ATPase subunit b